MLKKDVIIGARYVVRWHDGSFTTVTLRGEFKRGYWATNDKTGRHIRIKSAAKLRTRVA